ncbi:hypothetical protein Echvi_2683 [Echinicola vietnamensis DSM 17526]|uniref:Uncharacterized protein n=1 Tax=Echinicola vietnamensis (strain DSM 17526 / LMG 23754 / KMM 6221) TaxID=926556 RepID=L0G0U6_ECHVK|nr:hypothetical protein Echvi_2683 [Echinicola vietnamensis DSM 17526]
MKIYPNQYLSKLEKDRKAKGHSRYELVSRLFDQAAAEPNLSREDLVPWLVKATLRSLVNLKWDS